MQFHKDDPEYEWKKENGERENPFDFDAFLDQEGDSALDDKVTELLGGRELLEPDAFGASVADYVPGRRGEGDRGRHEVPEPESTAVQGDWQEDAPEAEPPADPDPAESAPPPPPERPRLDPNDPRYAAPERPHIVVAEPRRKVYIDPESAEEYKEPEEPRGMSEALKWVIAALIVVAILGFVFIRLMGKPLTFDFDLRGFVTNLLPSFETTEVQPVREESVEYTAVPAAATPAPTSETTPEPQIATHFITVTAGSGGTVSPSGVVAVREGESVTFSIVPDGNHALSQLIVDGVQAEMGGTYTFPDIDRDHTIYAVFQEVAPDPTPEPLPENTPEPVTPEPLPEETPEPVTPEPLPTEPPEAEPEPYDEPEPDYGIPVPVDEEGLLTDA